MYRRVPAAVSKPRRDTTSAAISSHPREMDRSCRHIQYCETSLLASCLSAKAATEASTRKMKDGRPQPCGRGGVDGVEG